MTATEWLKMQLGAKIADAKIEISAAKFFELIKQAKEMEKNQMTLLVESLKDYTKEAQCVLGNDDREASEFVEIYLNPFKEEQTAWGQGMAPDELNYYNETFKQKP